MVTFTQVVQAERALQQVRKQGSWVWEEGKGSKANKKRNKTHCRAVVMVVKSSRNVTYYNGADLA